MMNRIRVLLLGLLIGCAVRPAMADEAASTVRLVPDWELKGPVAVVWPEHLRRQRSLVEPISGLIRTLPPDRDVAVLSPRPPSMSALEDLGRDVRYLPTERVRDVFVRDWAGLPAADAEGRLFAVKFRYQPTHLERGDVARAYDNHHTGVQLAQRLYGADTEIPLTASGSAITHNGNGTAIVSQRIIAENEHLSIQAIRDVLREHAGLTRVVFVPVRPDDEAGLLTGLIRFGSESAVLITQYRHDDKRAAFADQLAAQVRRELGPDFRIARLPHAATDDADAPPLGGSYIDFIALNDHLLVPQFDKPEDKVAREVLAQILPDRQIIPIEPDLMEQLRREGLAPSRTSVIY